MGFMDKIKGKFSKENVEATTESVKDAVGDKVDGDTIDKVAEKAKDVLSKDER